MQPGRLWVGNMPFINSVNGLLSEFSHRSEVGIVIHTSRERENAPSQGHR